MTVLDHAKSVMSVVVFTVNLSVWAIVLVVLGCAKALLPPARPRLDRMLDGCYRAAVAVHDGWMRSGIRVSLRQPELGIPRDELCIVLSNHQCFADIPLLQGAIARRGPLLKFLSKRELAWVPVLGVIFWAFDFPLLRRGTKQGQDDAQRREADRQALSAACDAVRRRPSALMVFAEGTRSSPSKIEERGSPYRHLLPPRVGGFASLVEALGTDLVSIIDVTIVSPEPLTFWEFVSGSGPAVTIEAERIAASELPEGRDALAKWIGERWAAKDDRIEAARRG